MDNQEHKPSIDDYYLALNAFDKSVCEACAVSNFTADRYAVHYKGHASHVFTRICAHSMALISALPKSRWAKREYECWDFANIASHVRALMEGYILFFYLSDTPESEDEWYVKLNIMHLNDCTRRIRLYKNLNNEKEVQGFEVQKKEIKERLKKSIYFLNLEPKLQKQLLTGKALMIPSRDQMLEKLGINVGEFNTFYDVISNYTHILPISYYRNESNGRGTGVYNQTDLSYMILSLFKSSNLLNLSINRMVELFPDAQKVRKGKKSKFTIGPKENMKKKRVFSIHK
ncbi:DUF5677 domain-containing protein [Photobacterium leiognathi]|uniref:DUF5677 domain-containing protein n=1 Tax=Photobacterium leiognathi TaxID=553611 RepID=UPI002981A0C9|nr:DUF5677 domain-containing protein [Photobacterium leiognathi]